MNMAALLKQAQKMQKEMKTAENELKNKNYTASVGGKAVEVSVSGKCEITALHIDEDLLSKDRKEEVEELIILAVNEALSSMNKEKEETMNAFTAGMKMPGVF